jgi:light-regulated signal transduction histidine kinase (bacteriophytochrome)
MFVRIFSWSKSAKIADNGIGFEKEYENKIFELFQRLHHKMNIQELVLVWQSSKKL